MHPLQHLPIQALLYVAALLCFMAVSAAAWHVRGVVLSEQEVCRLHTYLCRRHMSLLVFAYWSGVGIRHPSCIQHTVVWTFRGVAPADKRRAPALPRHAFQQPADVGMQGRPQQHRAWVPVLVYWAVAALPCIRHSGSGGHAGAGCGRSKA